MTGGPPPNFDNPQIKIHHHIAGFRVDDLQALQRAGIIKLDVGGLLPLVHRGTVEDNPLYKLGLELKQKYFT